MNTNTAAAIALHFMAKQHEMPISDFAKDSLGIPSPISDVIRRELADTINPVGLQTIYDGIGDDQLVEDFLDLIEAIILLAESKGYSRHEPAGFAEKLEVIAAINVAIKKLPNGLKGPDFDGLCTVIESLLPKAENPA